MFLRSRNIRAWNKNECKKSERSWNTKNKKGSSNLVLSMEKLSKHIKKSEQLSESGKKASNTSNITQRYETLIMLHRIYYIKISGGKH